MGRGPHLAKLISRGDRKRRFLNFGKFESGSATKQQVIDWVKVRAGSKGKRGGKSLATGEQE